MRACVSVAEVAFNSSSSSGCAQNLRGRVGERDMAASTGGSKHASHGHACGAGVEQCGGQGTQRWMVQPDPKYHQMYASSHSLGKRSGT